MLFSVQDKQNRYLNDLKQEDIQVLENGQPQDIFTFKRELDLPLTMAILVDVSGSEQFTLPYLKDSGGRFVDAVVRTGKDTVAVIKFEGEATVMQELTSNPKRVRKALEDIAFIAAPPVSVYGGATPPINGGSRQGGTSLYDSVIATSADMLAREPGRKTIILLTDGVDTTSRMKLDEAINESLRSEVVIYSIGIGDPGMGGVNEGVLKKLSGIDRRARRLPERRPRPGQGVRAIGAGPAPAISARLRAEERSHRRRLPQTGNSGGKSKRQGSEGSTSQRVLRASRLIHTTGKVTFISGCRWPASRGRSPGACRTRSSPIGTDSTTRSTPFNMSRRLWGLGRALFLGYNSGLWELAHSWVGLPPEKAYLALRYGVIAQAGAGVIGVYALCKELTAGRLAAFFGALIVSLSPYYIIYSGRAMSEVPGLLALSWSLWWMARSLRTGKTGQFLAAAALLGLSANIREFAVFYLPFIPVAARIYRGRWRTGFVAFFLAVVCAFAGMIFWKLYDDLYWDAVVKWYRLSAAERRVHPVTSANLWFFADYAFNCSVIVSAITPLAVVWLWSRPRLRALAASAS